jgi:DNA polymerase III alpha subunit
MGFYAPSQLVQDARRHGVEVRPVDVLFSGIALREAAVDFAAPREGENIVADYRSLGLTLERHPLALLRTRWRRSATCRPRPCANAATTRWCAAPGSSPAASGRAPPAG